MNYTSTKETGAIIKKICSLFNRYDPIDVAKNLPCTVSEYIVATRFAFFEIKTGLRMHKELLIQVIDKYVSSEEVRKVLFTHPFFKNEETRMDFIDANVDNQFCLMQKMRCDYIALDLLAHPECYDLDKHEELVKNYIEAEIALTQENCIAFDLSLKHVSMFRNQSKINEEETQPKYIIGIESLLLDIRNLLIENDIIDESNSITSFTSAIEKADVSTIILKANKKTKFRCSLSPLSKCIKFDKRKWLREACASIDCVPSTAAANVSNEDKWYSQLRKIVKKHTNL